ncbi:MAG: DUF4920 domain-containing protein [Bacteroidia bacterium]|nr:DUF4920 domain-containing protein [Bacteroidia bacterium]
MKKIIVFASLMAFLYSCGNSNNSHTPSSDSLQTVPADKTNAIESVQYYGEKVNEDSVVSIADLKAHMGNNKELKVKLRGEIEAVCQKKGCWMKLRNPDGEAIHVTFKDYAFFIPTDAAGRSVIVEGIAKIEETSIADQQEYARDGNKTKEEVAAIKQPKTELVFEASGVIVK